MKYRVWSKEHYIKHKIIIDKLLKKSYSNSEILDYFRWKNIKNSDEDFCILFRDSKKCHSLENLNCYFCGCPNFCFDDSALEIKSWCSIDSSMGDKVVDKLGYTHQDCNNCELPHLEKFIISKFNLDWSKVMC